MNIKEEVTKILNEKSLNMAVLANQLGFNEVELVNILENNTVELRVLELISKELRVPLYSFFRNDFDSILPKSGGKLYYNVNLYASEETKYKLQINVLMQEIQGLKSDLREKDMIIEMLESQFIKTLK